MNTINIVGNAVLLFGFHMGVAGVAIPTTVSRMAAALIIVALLFLYIGVPNGLENSMFQLGKIVVLSLVSTFGTSAIAANAVGNITIRS